MTVINQLNFETFTECVATIGIFDGVHTAHVMLLQKLKKIAFQKKLPTVVITFWPHPRAILHPYINLHFLTTQSEKYEQLNKTGLVDFVIEIPFTETFSKLTANDFVQNILIQKLQVKALVLGYDHHFGKNREGNIRFFDNNKFNFEVFEILQQKNENITINSSNIRKKLVDGEIESANLLLGRKYAIKGIVVEGNKIGRTLGFATANLAINKEEKLLPNGVFIVNVAIKEKIFNGLLNIGIRPTLHGFTKTVEVHILDFNENIYGQEIEILLLHKIRNEQEFDSIESLKNQINLDKKYALSHFDTRN